MCFYCQRGRGRGTAQHRGEDSQHEPDCPATTASHPSWRSDAGELLDVAFESGGAHTRSSSLVDGAGAGTRKTLPESKFGLKHPSGSPARSVQCQACQPHTAGPCCSRRERPRLALTREFVQEVAGGAEFGGVDIACRLIRRPVREQSTPTATLTFTTSMTRSAGDQRGYQEAELIGDFKAVGRELEPKGKPVQARTHDFKDKDLGHAILYGVLDLTRDEGWVNVGIDRDTAQFAAASIRDWWESLGKERYPNATELTVTADSGGSNSYRTRLWNVEPGKLVDATGLRVIVCHFPPGTGKWNKIEHRLFSFMSFNWRGKPLISHEALISLITSTTIGTGLKVYAQLDDRPYLKGVEVTDQQLAAVNITRNPFHGEWNYTIAPSTIKA